MANSNLHIIFNDPVTPEQENELIDVIVSWVEAHHLTIAVVPGEEADSEEGGDVQENE